jgi:choline-sulfatase
MNLSIGFFTITIVVGIQSPAMTAEKPNVLFIAIDDLNDWVGCLDGHPQAKTPNIDRLAKAGTLFTNAHCQAPICNPSRTSFMLGLRPSTTGVYLNSPWFRLTRANKDRITMSQYFAQHGYSTLTTGKIYHGSRVDKLSFQIVGPRPGQRSSRDRQVVKDVASKSKLWDFGPQTYPEEEFADFADATWAIDMLKQQSFDKPFFMAVGFYRPHVPFYAPTRFFDRFPLDTVQLPTSPDFDRADLPAAAIQLTANATPPPHAWFVEQHQWKPAVQAYLASVAFTDAQVGRLLDALETTKYADNTIIVLLSDHGFHLGEKKRWAKQSLWERSTRVPLIVSLPNGKHGTRCSRAVELLSLYPTLIELCGLPPKTDLEGLSIVPLLNDTASAWNRPAITTYQRNNHSVRSEHFRYVRYANGAEELYDHRIDRDELENLASDSSMQPVIAELKKWLPKINRPDSASEVKSKKRQRSPSQPGLR